MEQPTELEGRWFQQGFNAAREQYEAQAALFAELVEALQRIADDGTILGKDYFKKWGDYGEDPTITARKALAQLEKEVKHEHRRQVQTNL